MTGRIATIIAVGLLLVHTVLAVWALAGLVELAGVVPPWPPISNPLFSVPVLLAQWTLVLLAAVVFIAGYLARWRHTPAAMAIIYAGMAALCAFQTFAILVHDHRFIAMALEYVAYIAILLFLTRTRAMQERFGRVSVSSETD